MSLHDGREIRLKNLANSPEKRLCVGCQTSFLSKQAFPFYCDPCWHAKILQTLARKKRPRSPNPDSNLQSGLT